MSPFSFSQFAGLHVYLIVADLIYNILDKIISSFYDNLLSPVINVLIGKDLMKLLTYKIGPEEEDVIKIGAIISEVIKMFFIFLIIFYTYKFAKKYKKFQVKKLAK